MNENLATEGSGWYRFAEIVFDSDTTAKGSCCTFVEILIVQLYNASKGCCHNIKLYLQYSDEAKMTSIGNNKLILQKVRLIRKDTVLYLDVYSAGRVNDSYFLLYIPVTTFITSARCVKPHLVSEAIDGEIKVCSIDLTDSV